MKEYLPLTVREEEIAKLIVDSAYQVHRTLGPGLLESVYEPCFCYELEKHGLTFECQVPLQLNYDHLNFHSAYRLDVLVEHCVICELKAIEILSPLHSSQLLTYLKLSHKRLGFLINFNVPTMKLGLKRIIL